MKNYEVVGHIKEFDNPEFCEKVNDMFVDSGETFELEDEHGNKKTIHIAKIKPEIKKEMDEYYLVRFHKAFASQDMIKSAQLKNRAVFRVNEVVLFSDRGIGYKWKEPVDLVLLDDKTGECITFKYLEKFGKINEIEDENIKKYELDKLTVDRRSIIEYKDGDRIIEGIVLDMNVPSYMVVDREDFKDLVHDRKKYDEVMIKVIPKDRFVRTFAILDAERGGVIEEIEKNCKVAP